MPKFACRCGHVMNLSPGSTSFEFALVPESRIDQIAEKLDSPSHLSSDMLYKLVDEVKTTIYRCLSCGRLHVDNGKGLFDSFISETEVDPGFWTAI